MQQRKSKDELEIEKGRGWRIFKTYNPLQGSGNGNYRHQIFFPQFGTSPTGYHYGFRSVHIKFYIKPEQNAIPFYNYFELHYQAGCQDSSVCTWLHYWTDSWEADTKRGSPLRTIRLWGSANLKSSEYRWFSPRGYSSLAVMWRGWEWMELYLHSLNTSLSYEFGSFWTSVHIYQTTRFHIQGAHKFNTQWRHNYKPQHPSFIIPWRRIFCPTFPVWMLRCQSWFAPGSSQQRDS